MEGRFWAGKKHHAMSAGESDTRFGRGFDKTVRRTLHVFELNIDERMKGPTDSGFLESEIRLMYTVHIKS